MNVRPVHDADLPQIVAIYNDAIEHTVATFDVTPFSPDERRPWFDQFDDEHPLLVAEEGDQIAGYAYYLPYRAKPAYSRTVELSVYVAPGWRRRGVARELYRALIDHAAARGVHAMIAVLAGNNPASESLHRSFGFTQVGHLREVGHKFGAWVDTRYYQRLL